MALISYLWIFLLTFLPFLELRYSIPIGIYGGIVALPFGLQFMGYALNPWVVLFVAVIANFLVAVLIYLVLDWIHEFLLKIRIVNKIYERRLERLHKKVHPLIERWGVFGLALFIAIPLPGSGVYSGALAAYILGMDYKDYLKAALIGVLIAGIIVFLISTLVFNIL